MTHWKNTIQNTTSHVMHCNLREQLTLAVKGGKLFTRHRQRWKRRAFVRFAADVVDAANHDGSMRVKHTGLANGEELSANKWVMIRLCTLLWLVSSLIWRPFWTLTWCYEWIHWNHMALCYKIEPYAHMLWVKPYANAIMVLCTCNNILYFSMRGHCTLLPHYLVPSLSFSAENNF